jgi:predicted phosphoribosyltransferase
MDASRSRCFRDRADAGLALAAELRQRTLHDPLVLAIPRGGVVVGAVIARELNAELDIVLARKLRSPHQPEYALGAVSETGRVTLNPDAQRILRVETEYLQEETRRQLAEIEERKKLFRGVRPPAAIAGRTVIVTDDGIATGSTMIAALQAVRGEHPRELIVAAPVAAPDRLAEVRRYADDAVCLLHPDDFHAVGQFYHRFAAVEDEEALRLLRENFARSSPGRPD